MTHRIPASYCTVLALLLVAAALCSCSSTRMAVAEKMGYAKREQLSDRVAKARDAQIGAKKQFQTALDEFLAVTKIELGQLEDQFDSLRKAYERSEDKAADVHQRIKDVEVVGTALFREWKEELRQYSSDTLRASSEAQLAQTRERYDALIGAMKAAEAKMTPVLAALKDQVLFLKHNLNARAIASLQGNVAALETDVSALIRDMEASIAEANTFIEQIK